MWEMFRNLRPAFMGSGNAASPATAENRDLNPASCSPTDIWGFPFDIGGSGGEYVSMSGALSVPAVWDAVKKVSETLASLPLDLFLKTDGGSQPAKDHPVRYIVRTEPFPNTTSYDFRRALFARACFGDAFAKIHRNGIGRPVKLELMKGMVRVVETDSGQAAYVWNWTRGNSSGQEVLLAQEVLHVKGFSLDTLKGMDVSVAHKDTLGFAVSANRYGNAFFSNFAGIDKAIVYPQVLTKQQLEQAQKAMSASAGIKKVGGIKILDGGVKIENMGLNPEESLLNESRAFQVNEVARVFGVPVHLLQNMDRATFNNIEMMTTLFVTLCLRPWAVQAEQEMAMKLLTRSEKESEDLFFRHNFEGLLRGDTAARASFYASGILNGWLLRNEVRGLENLNTIEGLDKPLVPVNMAMIEADGEVKQPETTATTNTPAPAQAGSGGKKNSDGTPQTQPAA